MRNPAPADELEQEGDGTTGVSTYIIRCHGIFARSVATGDLPA
jgi:hypothetical protein